MAKIIGDRFDKEVVKGKVNNDVASSAPKKVSISLDRYEEEFKDFEFTSFHDGMENYLDWYQDENVVRYSDNQYRSFTIEGQKKYVNNCLVSKDMDLFGIFDEDIHIGNILRLLA